MERRVRVAAYALVREEGRILLCRLINGDWTLPGGGLEFGEAPDEAAVREVREETGLEVQLTGLAGIDSELALEGTFHGIRIVYWATRTGGELRDECDGTTDCARFFTPDEARRLPQVSLTTYGLDRAFPLETP